MDELPCGDFALLVPLKRSPEYGAVRPRVADLKPMDSWQVGDLHYFVFELRPPNSADSGDEPYAAVFAMRQGQLSPVSAVVVRPRASGFVWVMYMSRS